AANTWTAAAAMNTGRISHTATLLPGGQVLFAGGIDQNLNESASAEVYDPGINPSIGTLTFTGAMNYQRMLAAATLLPNGKVLVEGGNESLSTAELFDPGTGTWSVTGSTSGAWQGHVSTLLPNGKVLVTGQGYA